jgi:hypothetical protein
MTTSEDGRPEPRRKTNCDAEESLEEQQLSDLFDKAVADAAKARAEGRDPMADLPVELRRALRPSIEALDKVFRTNLPVARHASDGGRETWPKVSREEKAVLWPIVKRLRLAYPHAWSALKRETWDRGFQFHYHFQAEFDVPAKKALSKLSEIHAEVLRLAWSRRNAMKEVNWAEVVDDYSYVIVQELVHRATIAAYRTDNW